MPGNPELDALMGLAAQQQGGAPGGAPPGAGGPPGAPQGGPPPGGPPGAGGGGQPDPMQLLQMSLMGLAEACKQIGILESGARAVEIITRAMQKMQKTGPAGRQAAGMGQAMGGAQPPGVGPMPGGNMS